MPSGLLAGGTAIPQIRIAWPSSRKVPPSTTAARAVTVSSTAPAVPAATVNTSAETPSILSSMVTPSPAQGAMDSAPGAAWLLLPPAAAGGYTLPMRH